ncbi:MAG: hypothetical protein U0744_12710 [Gemmataceae bacterium]
MDQFWWIFVAVVGAVGLAWALGRGAKTFGREMRQERARELFKLQRERLEARFLQAASATGKPRGLRWKDCQWENEVEFVRDRETDEVAALVGVTIQFEAIEGGDMEGVAAVSNLRHASAVFAFQHDHWITAGKALFNMFPAEAVEKLDSQYERLAT